MSNPFLGDIREATMKEKDLEETLNDSSGRSPSPRRKKAGSGRVCRLCGKDPYPNYFYCQTCHHKLSSSSFDDTNEESMMEMNP